MQYELLREQLQELMNDALSHNGMLHRALLISTTNDQLELSKSLITREDGEEYILRVLGELNAHGQPSLTYEVRNNDVTRTEVGQTDTFFSAIRLVNND